jgi:transposase
VVTGLHGMTGRDIMDHLIAGERNPKTLAQLARARARRKITELEQALEGAEFFTAEHAALLSAMLGRIDQITAEIGRLTAVIERLLAPRAAAFSYGTRSASWSPPAPTCC